MENNEWPPYWEVPSRPVMHDLVPVELEATTGRDRLDPFRFQGLGSKRLIAIRAEYASFHPGHLLWDTSEMHANDPDWSFSEILEAFLAVKTVDELERFVGKYGPLLLCERHAMPVLHGSHLFDGGEVCMWWPSIERAAHRSTAIAWIAWWQGTFKTVADIGVRISAGRPADKSLWDQIGWIPTNLGALQGDGRSARAHLGKDLALDRRAYGATVSRLLNWAHVRPTLVWHDDWPKPRLQFIESTTAGVFGPLVLGLVNGFAGIQTFRNCVYCGEIFTPRQQRVIFCDRVGCNGSQKMRDQRRYAKGRE